MMGSTQTIRSSGRGVSSARRDWWWSTVRWLGQVLRRKSPAPRSRRIFLLVLLIWIIGLADLLFTVLARDIGHFRETNPIAASLIQTTGWLVTFKLASLIIASVIFIGFRRRLITEVACWLVSGVHVGLAFIWLSYYYGLG